MRRPLAQVEKRAMARTRTGWQREVGLTSGQAGASSQSPRGAGGSWLGRGWAPVPGAARTWMLSSFEPSSRPSATPTRDRHPGWSFGNTYLQARGGEEQEETTEWAMTLQDHESGESCEGRSTTERGAGMWPLPTAPTAGRRDSPVMCVFKPTVCSPCCLSDDL